MNEDISQTNQSSFDEELSKRPPEEVVEPISEAQLNAEAKLRA